MSQTSNASQSILPAVAKQEQELLARIRASEEEAQAAIEKARADARSYRQERDSSLVEQVAIIRGEAEKARLQEFQGTVDAAEARLVEVREASLRRVPETAKEVLALFLPTASGGTQS